MNKKIKIITIVTLILSLVYFVVPNKVFAKKIIFSENFDNDLIENWITVRSMQWSNSNRQCMYFNEPAQWKIINGEIGIEIYGPPCVTELIHKDFNLSQINNFEYTFDWHFKNTIYADRNVIFLWKDKNNWYDFKITSNHILLQKVINGMSLYVPKAESTYNFESNKKYHFSITVQNDNIVLKVDGNEIINTTDSLPKIEGWKTLGFQASVGAISSSQSYFDNVVVYDLDAPDIKEAPLVKQNDPAWAQTEYDSAKQWSVNPSISRWGCALTSSVMILKAHGINSLPGAENLDPASLNEWLKKQPDGYFPNGLINWLAIGRLTKQLSSVLNTPTLEYKRINYSNNWLQDVLNQIDHQKPVILELPGHFLVADNYTTDKSDLLIKDPFYSYTNFSQHQKMPQSIRVFTPSQTDLSYIIVAVDEKVDLKIEDVDIATHSAQASEYLTTLDENPEQNEQSKKIKIISLEKPALGNYQISLTQPNFSQINLTIFTYDQNGEVKDLSTNIYVGQTPVQYTLQYTKSQDDTLKRKADFSTFKELIKELGLAQEITKPAVEIWLDYFATLAETQSLNNQVRYISLLKETVGWFENKMSSVAKNVLLQELWEIKNNLQQL